MNQEADCLSKARLELYTYGRLQQQKKAALQNIFLSLAVNKVYSLYLCFAIIFLEFLCTLISQDMRRHQRFKFFWKDVFNGHSYLGSTVDSIGMTEGKIQLFLGTYFQRRIQPCKKIGILNWKHLFPHRVRIDGRPECPIDSAKPANVSGCSEAEHALHAALWQMPHRHHRPFLNFLHLLGLQSQKTRLI